MSGVGPRLDHVVIIKPSPNFVGTAVGTSVPLIARAYDQRGAELIEGVRFQWASSDTTIMLVDQSGNVFTKRTGDATIHLDASRDGRTSSDSVTLFGVIPV